MNNTIMVTGAAGFVAGQTMLCLKDAGYAVIAVDWSPMPTHLQGIADVVLQEDFASDTVLEAINKYQPRAIIHCAATSLVGPSVKNPQLYYYNNFIKTKTLLDYIISKHPQIRVIASSSSSVYGEPVMVPCREEDPPMPLSPYGQSKHMMEQMMTSYAHAYGLNYVAFRYFNVCGADSQQRHGQPPGATHIIARVLESIKSGSEFRLNGTDYPTPDGTCVRDHVHVEDVAAAHILASQVDFPPGIYNVGIEHGASNMEVATLSQKVTSQQLNLTTGPARPGDPSQLTADASKLKAQGWQPRYNLEDMIKHAWTWYNR